MLVLDDKFIPSYHLFDIHAVERPASECVWVCEHDLCAVACRFGLVSAGSICVYILHTHTHIYVYIIHICVCMWILNLEAGSW